MVLPYADDLFPDVVNDHVGVSHVSLGRDGDRRFSMPAPVHALVVVVDEVDHPIGHAKSAAAVLVDPAAGVEGRRRHVVNLPIGSPADDDVAPAFPGALLHPIDILSVQSQLAQPDRFGNDEVRRYRRFPRAIGRYLNFWHPFSLGSRCVLNFQGLV